MMAGTRRCSKIAIHVKDALDDESRVLMEVVVGSWVLFSQSAADRKECVRDDESSRAVGRRADPVRGSSVTMVAADRSNQ